MQKVVHRADGRGVAEHEWLHSRFSFSFADWFDETRMGFGTLRVINDDVIDPSSGFGMHPHRDMEIITIVTKGAVTHEDSMGNSGVVQAGEVQVMSAGTGVVHSERNESMTDALELFQIWILPDRVAHTPRYEQMSFPQVTRDAFDLLVGPHGQGAPLSIRQNAYIARAVLTKSALYTPHAKENGVYIFVVRGSATVAGEDLTVRDAVGVWDAETVAIVPKGEVELLCIEVPMQ